MRKENPTQSGTYSPSRVAWGWFVAFFCGWIAAMMAASIIAYLGINLVKIITGGNFSAVSQLLTVLVLFVVLYAVGNIVGYVQWKWSLRDLLSEQIWRRASVLTTFCLLAAMMIRVYLFGDTSLYVCEYHDGWTTSCILASNWQTRFIFGSLLYGLVIALPQWWTLRRCFKRANWWIVANLIGLTLYHVITINQYENYFNSWFIGLDVLFYSIPLYALITSLTLYYMASGEKQKRKPSS